VLSKERYGNYREAEGIMNTHKVKDPELECKWGTKWRVLQPDGSYKVVNPKAESLKQRLIDIAICVVYFCIWAGFMAYADTILPWIGIPE
jgi:hypothetical protein